MAALSSEYTSNDLKSILIAELDRAMDNVIPLVERIGTQMPVQKGTNQVRVVTRQRVGKMADVDTAAYPSTAGYKPVNPTVGPILTYGPSGKALYSNTYDNDEFHHSQRTRVIADFAMSAANALNRHAVARLEAANSTSVTYTQGDGTSRTSALFAVSGSPWYTKSGTAVSNVISAALSANSLDQAITRMQSAINWEDDTPMNLPIDMGMILLVPPALRSLAKTITGSPVFPLSAVSFAGGSAVTGDVMNVMAEYGVVPVVCPDLADSAAAYLISPRAEPMTYAVFTPRNTKVVEKAAPQGTEISVTTEIGAELNPFEFGAIRIAA